MTEPAGLTWRLRVRHVTGFTYAGTAQASYNEARMTPMTVPGQTTLHSTVDIQPAALTWRYHDYWGTHVTVFDLQRPHQQLRVTASSLVETSDPAGTAGTGPDWADLRTAAGRDEHAEVLAPTPLTAVAAELVGEAAGVVSGAAPGDAAVALAQWVRENVAYVPGSTGVHTGAQEAWALRKGVCQDIAHLTVGLLRAVGIPARYVSGYLHPGVAAEVGETVAGQSHAWVEWWTGAWVGFDPTNGVPAGRRHVLVARGRDYADVTPLKGVYHGAPSSHLGVTVEITRLA
jgi:transglutaminase-like putative cysteine protease